MDMDARGTPIAPPNLLRQTKLWICKCSNDTESPCKISVFELSVHKKLWIGKVEALGCCILQCGSLIIVQILCTCMKEIFIFSGVQTNVCKNITINSYITYFLNMQAYWKDFVKSVKILKKKYLKVNYTCTLIQQGIFQARNHE